MGKNYYEVLGVPKGTSDAGKIKKAYRKLALRFHPDKPTGDTAKFQGLYARHIRARGFSPSCWACGCSSR